ncbi:MAG: ferredoxin [bacterium]|nr:ferredoxin [bacterium]
MSKIPTVDKELCIGCGTCAVIANKSFKMNKEGKAEVIIPPGDNEALIHEAIESCAVVAITYNAEEK